MTEFWNFGTSWRRRKYCNEGKKRRSKEASEENESVGGGKSVFLLRTPKNFEAKVENSMARSLRLGRASLFSWRPKTLKGAAPRRSGSRFRGLSKEKRKEEGELYVNDNGLDTDCIIKYEFHTPICILTF